MEEEIQTITPEVGEIIRRNTHLTVKELSEVLNIKPGKIYYYIRKNNISVKKNKSTVEKFLEKIQNETEE